MEILRRFHIAPAASSVSDSSNVPAKSHPDFPPTLVDAQSEKDSPQATAFTGNDTVLGPTAPVGDFKEEKSSSADSSHDTDVSREDKDGTNGEKTSVNNGQTDDNHSQIVVEEKEGKAAGYVEPLQGEEEEKEEEEEDESKYPGGWALAILTFGLCMATFVVALDNTIIGEHVSLSSWT